LFFFLLSDFVASGDRLHWESGLSDSWLLNGKAISDDLSLICWGKFFRDKSPSASKRVSNANETQWTIDSCSSSCLRFEQYNFESHNWLHLLFLSLFSPDWDLSSCCVSCNLRLTDEKKFPCTVHDKNMKSTYIQFVSLSEVDDSRLFSLRPFLQLLKTPPLTSLFSLHLLVLQ
jgi:hypothetical protein